MLDLFAGSGQLGIEALSRGAASCVFLDQDRAAVAVIAANCRAAGVFGSSRVAQGEAGAFLAAAKERFHIVLLDPPYHQGTLEAILPAVARVTEPGGTVPVSYTPLSSLTAVPGVGPATAKALLAEFRTVAAVREAGVEELCRAKGVGRAAAAAIYDHFHPAAPIDKAP